MGLKKWKIRNENSAFSQELSNEFEVSPLVAKILSARGCDSFEKAEEFLFSEGQLSSPFFIKDMTEAVNIIKESISRDELIVVYGDYDCDGITATALLTKYLGDVGASVSYYIPPRSKGYGLNKSSLKKLKDKGVDLVITVDNGITAIEEIEFANEIGLKIIITDHHTPLENLPPALAVVNPHRKDCLSSCKNISGVGVALKLICAMEDDYECSETMYTYGAYAAIGTVADIVDLTGENREIVRSGIERLREGWILGISYLCEIAGVDEENLTSTDLAYMIAPRINASGRVGNTNKAVELLLTEDENEAKALAEEINGYNVARKELEQQIYLQAIEKIEEDKSILANRVLVIWGEGWHHGVTGIVCARLVEKYSKPCIVFSIEGEEARGTCRSIEGYNIIESICRCSRLLIKYGGHNQAAGLTLQKADLEDFIIEIQRDASKYYDIMPISTVNIDAEVESSMLAIDNVRSLECLQPYGEGNGVPIFAIKGAKVEEVLSLSAGKHTKLKLSSKGNIFFVLCFGVPTYDFQHINGKMVDIAFTASINSYNGNESISLKLKDVRPAGIDEEQVHIESQVYEKFQRGERLNNVLDLVPCREEMAELYRYIRQCITLRNDTLMIHSELNHISYFKVNILRDILLELKLIYINEAGRLTIVPKPQKTDIESSRVLGQLKNLV